MRFAWAPWKGALDQALQTAAMCVQMFVFMMLGELISLVVIGMCLVCLTFRAFDN